jgi:hypothetical protein
VTATNISTPDGDPDRVDRARGVDLHKVEEGSGR